RDRPARPPLIAAHAGDPAVGDHHVGRLDATVEDVDDLAPGDQQVAGLLPQRHADPPPRRLHPTARRQAPSLPSVLAIAIHHAWASSRTSRIETSADPTKGSANRDKEKGIGRQRQQTTRKEGTTKNTKSHEKERSRRGC